MSGLPVTTFQRSATALHRHAASDREMETREVDAQEVGVGKQRIEQGGDAVTVNGVSCRVLTKRLTSRGSGMSRLFAPTISGTKQFTVSANT